MVCLESALEPSAESFLSLSADRNDSSGDSSPLSHFREDITTDSSDSEDRIRTPPFGIPLASNPSSPSTSPPHNERTSTGDMTKRVANPMTKAEAGALGAQKKRELRNSGTSKTESSTGQAPAKKRQRLSRNMLDSPPTDPAPATSERPEYLPTHLPHLDLPGGDVPVPVILVTNGGDTYEITNRQTLSSDWANFWHLARGRVTQLLEVFPEDEFGTMLTDLRSEADLTLRSTVFPTLFTRMAPMLNYHKPSAQAQQMNKDTFKTFLNYLIRNAGQLLEELKDTTIPTALQPQRQGQGAITSRLLTATPPAISAIEHNMIVRNIVASTNDMAELVRRELCTYGTAVNATAQRAVNNLAQIRTIGEHLQGILTPAVDEIKEEAEEPWGCYAISSVPKAPQQQQHPGVAKDGAAVAAAPIIEIEEQAESSSSNRQPSPSKSSPPTLSSLPLLLVRTLMNDNEVHKCRCAEICEPDIHEKYLEKVRQEQGEQVKKEVELELRETYIKELGPELLEEAHEIVRKEALAKAKDEAVLAEHRRLEEQVRAELTPQISARVEKEFEQRVTTEVRARMEAMYRQVLPPVLTGGTTHSNP